MTIIHLVKEYKTTQETIADWNKKCTIDASYYPIHELCLDCVNLKELPVCSRYYQQRRA